MDTIYRFIEYEIIEDGLVTICLRQTRLNEHEVIDMSHEIVSLAREKSCPRVIIDFESKKPECLFSVFLAKLVTIQRQLEQLGGGLRLCNCNEFVMGIFDACRLSTIFDLRPDCENPTEGW